MANELSIFSNEEFGSVRVVLRDDVPWFFASDVAKALGYSNPSRSVQDHCKHAELFRTTNTVGLDINPRGELVVPESDVYRLIMRSNLPNAERFQDWVVEEVLPSIRKTGNYSMAPASAPGVRPLRDIAAIYEAAGIHGNQLALALDKFYKAESGMSALGAAGIELKEPKQDVHYNATQLGELMGGVKARAVNKMLAAAGLQEATPAGWRPTEFGKQYSVLLDTGKKMGNGTPVTQLKWYPTVLDIIA